MPREHRLHAPSPYGLWAEGPLDTHCTLFFCVGSNSGNRAVLTVTRTRGGRFIPNFNAAAISNPVWGTLTISFSGCNNGRVDFDSDLGFGSGSMPQTRLSLPLGQSCL